LSDERLFTRPFVLCSIANLMQGIAFNLFLHFPGFLKDLGAREAEIGLISGLTAVASILVRPWVGRSMDLRGRRGIILLGNAINVAVIGLYLTVTQVGPWVYLVRIFHGLSEAMLFTSMFTFAADHVPRRRLTQGLALFGVSGMLPMSLGGVFGDVILTRADYDALFITALGFAVVALLLSLPLYDKPRSTTSPEEPPRGFTAALAQRDLVSIWWITTIFSVALAAVFIFVKTFVMTTGAGTVGGFFTAYTLTAIFFRVFLGWLPDRVGPKRVLFPALATLALGFFFLAGAESGREVLVAGMLCGAGHGYTFPILFGLTVMRARAAERGSAMAIYTALFDVGILLGGPLLGIIIEADGYGAMFGTAAVILVAGAVIFAVWDWSR
jgi:MFS family permease